MCPGLAEPNNPPLACSSADQCLKFCDHMLSVAMPSTTKNTENLDPNYFSSSDTDQAQLKCMPMDCWAQLSQGTLN